MKGEVDEDGICDCCGKQFSDIKLSESYLPVGQKAAAFRQPFFILLVFCDI